ncbi:DUF6387 family protein [Acinetobacter sp. ANC 4636]
MRKIIKSTDELPSIFNIDKYSDMDKLSAFDWFFLFQTRFLLHDLLENGLSTSFIPKNELSEDEEDEAISQIIKTHLENPLSLDLVVNYTKHNGKNIVIDVSTSDHYSFMRKNLPVSELYEDEFSKMQNFVEYTGGKFKEWNDEKPYRPVADVINSSIGINVCLTDYPITINPFYPDDVIIKELQKLLIKIREKIGFDKKNKAISQKDLLNWASYKLLPYFDLKLFELYEGVKITNAVICSTLYPKGEYGEDNLRKSVEPIRKKILEQTTFNGSDEISEISIIDALAYLAYSEFDKIGKIFDQ